MAPNRSALAGTVIAGMFGVFWALWGASGVPRSAAGPIRIAGVAIGSAIVAWAVHVGRSGGPASAPDPTARRPQRTRSVFTSRGYLVVVGLEFVAILVGARVLAATEHGDYISAWIATVVGVHFLAFGRMLFRGFYWLGSALIGAGAAGALAGFAGGGRSGITATCGLLAAASLFAGAGWAVGRIQSAAPA